MTAIESAPPESCAAAFADLDHVVRNALMIVRGRTHHVQRTIRHDVSLSEVTSTAVQRDLAAIDAAVVTLVARLDALGP